MQLLSIEASDVLAGAHSALVDRVFRNELLGFVVRGVFAPAMLQRALRAVTSGEASLPSPPMEHFKGRQFGRTLVVAGADLGPYFADAAQFRSAAARLFGENPSFEERLTQVFSALTPELTVRAPIGPTGVSYGLSTLRTLEPNGTIALHCENETLRFPAMKHLQTLLDTTTQLSFYTPLQLPEGGGELRVYNACFGTPSAAGLDRRDRLAPETIALLEALEKVIPTPNVGDLLVFDAGRYYHRVTPVEGTRERWTMGGFIARSRDLKALHYWA